MITNEELSFEQAFAQLEKTVQQLEQGGLPLEESLALFERGQALVAHCHTQLDEAELKIKQLTPEGDAPLDAPHLENA
ncbi:MAG TPA: exodeoxyribonuclease VII small subunit [Chloroflexi bacterium]|nr:exodeoxyribonuclease VII small subunit [Chloroflexota bacterium]